MIQIDNPNAWNYSIYVWKINNLGSDSLRHERHVRAGGVQAAGVGGQVAGGGGGVQVAGGGGGVQVKNSKSLRLSKAKLW